MGLNPHAAAGTGNTEQMDIFVGEVVSTPAKSGPDGRNHTVTVSPEHTDGEVAAIVGESVSGDVSLPIEGTRVLCVVGYGGTVHLLGRLYDADESVPSLPVGERRVSHPLSDANVTFRGDGSVVMETDDGTSVELTDDGDVVIDGGGTRPVMDIGTTTDGDGHVTSIDITRADGVYLPSD